MLIENKGDTLLLKKAMAQQPAAGRGGSLAGSKCPGLEGSFKVWWKQRTYHRADDHQEANTFQN
jgi:hypothetical protein